MSWNEATQPRGMRTGNLPGVGRNYTKTAMLMAFLIALLAIGGNLAGGYQGMLLFGGLGLVFNFVSYWFSDRIALMAHRAQPVTREQLPDVYEIVERLTRKAGIPMPKIFVIPSETPNAFATGRNPPHAAVAVTEGILRILDKRQLEGVIAHELSHVRNRDILIATIAAAVAGLVSSLGYVVRWGAILGGGGNRDGERSGSGFEMLAWAILAPLVAMVIQFAVSRSREFGADASGAELTGDPDAARRRAARARARQRGHPVPVRRAGHRAPVHREPLPRRGGEAHEPLLHPPAHGGARPPSARDAARAAGVLKRPEP